MDNVEIVRNIFSLEHDPGSGRPEDAQRLIDRLAPDVVFRVTVPAGTPISGVFRGKQAVVDFLARLGSIATFRQEKQQEYFADGNRVVVLGDDSFDIKKGGITGRSEYAMVLDFRDGLIVRWTIIQDLSAFVEAYRGELAA